MTNIHPVFASFANKQTQPQIITQKKIETDAPKDTPAKPMTQKEEVKELLQSPKDPLAKYPLRGFGYANEIGAALSAMPGWGKTAEAALWVPALMYLGADIFDKYSRGKEGNYSQASVNKAVEQATFQALASVILPTAAVKMGQNLAATATKYDGSNLNANAQEELYKEILKAYDKGKFAKGDYVKDGLPRKGIDRIMDKVLDEPFRKLLNDTKFDLQKESKWSKVKRFFTHSTRPVSAATSNFDNVDAFMKKKITEVYDLQTKLENVSEENISTLDKKAQNFFRKALKNIDKKVSELMSENPSFIIKKLLNTNDEKFGHFKQEILSNYKSREELKVLLADQSQCAKLLEKMAESPENKTLLTSFTRKIKLAHDTLRPILKGKEMKLGWLKTTGGFIALACLAIPIDHFVHKYIIQKAVAPALENVEKLNQNFKKNQDTKVK